MSSVESLDLKNLHVIVMQEFQSEDIQELNSDFFRNLSSTIGKLKNEEVVMWWGRNSKNSNRFARSASPGKGFERSVLACGVWRVVCGVW